MQGTATTSRATTTQRWLSGRPKARQRGLVLIVENGQARNLVSYAGERDTWQGKGREHFTQRVAQMVAFHQWRNGRNLPPIRQRGRMAKKCGYRIVQGHRVWIPECMGGAVRGKPGCTCPDYGIEGRFGELEDRIGKLEESVFGTGKKPEATKGGE